MTTERRRVLILDDEPQTLRLLIGYLKAPQLDIVACSEIEAAECLMDRERFDILVTDLEVSALGGLEGIRLIRHVTAHFPKTSVIVFSGNIDPQVRALGEALGVVELLEKPGGLKRLRSLVNEGLPERGDRPNDEEGSVTNVESLEEVLRQGSVSAVLQPIVALESAASAPRFFGVEGLSRGPEGSLLRSPEILLDYSSRKEMLFETEMKCIEAVLREASHLDEVGKLFINVRPRSLSRPQFAASLTDLVRRHDRRESDIVLELTEQQSILNLQAFDRTLDALHESGFGLALDDYGSGFANLHLIQQLHLDYLKIDGLFCSEIYRDLKKQAIIRSTVEMARELGISTIMERVETKEELDVVRDLGVDYAQGYYFSRPVPGKELAVSLQPSPETPVASEEEEKDDELEAPEVPRPGSQVVHELSNEITSIALFAGQGVNGASSEEQLREDLKRICTACEKAIELTHELH